MIIFKIRFFKLSDIHKGLYKLAIQKKKYKKRFLSLFQKIYPRDSEKNQIFVYPGLKKQPKNICKIFWKTFFDYKI